MRIILSIFIAMLGIHSSIAIADSDDAQLQPDQRQEVSALVKVSPIREMQLNRHVSGYGTITAQPDTLESLNVPIAGQVESLYVVPGQWVSKGTTLLKINPDPAGSLAYKQAENAVRFAKGELKRTKSLFDRQLATRSQVAAAEKALADAKQALASQKNMGNGVRQTKVLAPFDGVVVSVGIARGDRFIAGANLLQLARNNSQQAVIGVDPAASHFLLAGQKVTLQSVFNDGQQATGTIAHVGRQIDPSSRLVNVTVFVDGAPFLTGTGVMGEITVAAHQGKAVPREAVLADEQGSYIFQVQGRKAKRIAVKAGTEDHGWIEVTGPLLDAPVVVLGNYELDEGMAVRIEK